MPFHSVWLFSEKGRGPIERGSGSPRKLRLRRAQHSEMIPPAGETPAPRLENRLAEPRSHSLRLRSFGASGPFPVGPKGSIYVNVRIRLKGRAEPPKATAKPYSRHILGIDSGVQSHPKATPKPHQSHTKATPKPHQSHTKATPKPHQSQLLRLFQRLEGAETACSPRVLAIMRIAAQKPCA